MDNFFDLCRKLQPLVTELCGGDALVCWSPWTSCFYVVDTRQRTVFRYLTLENVEDNLHLRDEFLRERLTGVKRGGYDPSF